MSVKREEAQGQNDLFQNWEALKAPLMQHSLPTRMLNLEDYRVFMKYHVFAVWDFMSVLKGLQYGLIGTSLPWMPQGDPIIRRMLNEIVLEEESDQVHSELYLSHYELYRSAMQEVGADDFWIRLHEQNIRQSNAMDLSLQDSRLPEVIRNFLKIHWTILQSGEIHRIAAIFALAREDIIPELFEKILHGAIGRSDLNAPRFRFYLERHIQLDGENHGPLSRRLLNLLIAGDPQKQAEALAAAHSSLQARCQLWDAVQKELSPP